MSILADFKMYGRFALGLRGFLKHTLTLEEAKGIVKKRMEEREDNFLRLVRKGIFGYPKSPYLPLLKLAQCEMGDIENMVKDKGLEGTLLALRESGVYITFEEFKGRKPIVRDGKVIPIELHNFDNPYINHYFECQTSGTTGKGTRVAMDLDHLAAYTPNLVLAHDAHDLFNFPTTVWFGVFPDQTGLSSILWRARIGNLPEKWFFPITSQYFQPPLKHRLATHAAVVIGRLCGVSIPWPEPLPLNDAIVVARWAAETLKAHGRCLIGTHVGMALRVCLAAQEENLDLTGTIFMGGGEPLTSTKAREIARSGARYISHYFFSETGVIGVACSRPKEVNDLHFCKDILALIQHPHQVPNSEIEVNAFHFTTLLPTAPKVMLNVESDDYGVIEKRYCGCPLDFYGCKEHLLRIRSFRKLTGEGVTLVGSDMEGILENILPERFGGSSLDYQIIEEEDEKGFTRLSLLVSPRLGVLNEEAVIETVLKALSRHSMATDMVQAIWYQAKTLRVKRGEPIWTSRAKLMPLHLSSEEGEKR